MAKTNFCYEQVALQNRIGQTVLMWTGALTLGARTYVFVKSPTGALPRVFSKNAEHFVQQLVSRLGLKPGHFDMIEVRERGEASDLHRWRFQWVETSPLHGNCERVSSSQSEFLISVLTLGEPVKLDINAPVEQVA